MFADWSEDYDENAAPSHTPILDDDDQHDNDDIASPHIALSQISPVEVRIMISLLMNINLKLNTHWYDTTCTLARYSNRLPCLCECMKY